ncbi:MAG: hypothetical protein AseanaTS_24800 [Candidatus Pelagadaptatus aseana]|uniref:alpha-E domain-containing protein n=1 Tax=Candidatus Pelagadaptatus aseana TaxID=3120508 RepID=UPI0039B29F93
MMLSKVAERVYWTARYLERVESTARLVSIYDQLLFDLPRSVQLSWYNLITINSLQTDFDERYKVRDERNVVKFLIGDESNISSVVSSLKAARENIRTTRDVIPQETWEFINELSLFVQDNLKQGINRSKRYEFLGEIIKSCQQILGMLYGNMPHDEVWSFLRLGRNLERADMTTRILDAGVSVIAQMQEDDSVYNSRQIALGNVLRSLNADQAYRRLMRLSVNGPAVVEFLLGHKAFPRSITHCLNSMIHAAEQLPNPKPVRDHLLGIHKGLETKPTEVDETEVFSDFLNNLQIQFAEANNLIAQHWFSTDVEQIDYQAS